MARDQVERRRNQNLEVVAEVYEPIGKAGNPKANWVSLGLSAVVTPQSRKIRSERKKLGIRRNVCLGARVVLGRSADAFGDLQNV